MHYVTTTTPKGFAANHPEFKYVERGRFSPAAARLLFNFIYQTHADRFGNIIGMDPVLYPNAWSDVMWDPETGNLYAVWASHPLDVVHGRCKYARMEPDDCPEAFEVVARKLAAEWLRQNTPDNRQFIDYLVNAAYEARGLK